MTNHSLRESFNGAAQAYDAIRPGYPPALIEDVAALAELPPAARLLEIGCGTGQATLPFARMGAANGRQWQIDCLDIGPDLLALAREKLSAYPQVRFHHVSFEDWPPEPGAFNLVYSATAFHWVPVEIGYPKAAQVLKAGGALAVFSNEHPWPYYGFFEESQPIYDRWMPRPPARGQSVPHHLDIAEEIRVKTDYINSLGLFAPVITRTYPWTQTYTTAEYLTLLNTYSDHRLLVEDRRRALYQELGDLIETRYGGKVEKQYLAVLYLARKQG